MNTFSHRLRFLGCSVSKPCGIALGLALSLLVLALLSIRADEPAKTEALLTPESQKTYEQRVLPFLKKYCWECHDKNSATAGFRVDDLGTDFLAGKTADCWREAIDQMNLGKMPKTKTKPAAEEVSVVVEWVNQELRNAEKRAQSTRGRVPMRRLNRTEYANTVRDLFYLDDHFARKIERELPSDGKVDGFDRGSAALLVDKSQLQVYLDVARLVVAEALPAQPPKVNKYRIQAAKDNWLTQVSPAKTKIRDLLSPGILAAIDYRYLILDQKELDREVETGTQVNELTVRRDGGLEVFASSNVLGYFERVAQPKQVVRQDGVYRCRIRAGASRGSSDYATDAVRIKADYCQDKWNRTSFTFTIDAPLEQPKVYEQEVYLQSGGPDFDRVLSFRWNSFYPFTGYGDTNGRICVLNWPLYSQVLATNRAGNNYFDALTKKEPADKLEAARKKRDAEEDKLRQAMLAFQGPVYQVKADVDLKALPRLWYEYIELEGPFVEWPTKATKELFFNGQEGDAEYARQIFARFLPRAYRRPVEAAEVEELVQSVQTMQTKHGKSFAEAVRASIVTVLTSPSFLYLQEPTGGDTSPHELNDSELATRLSYLLWSTMPDAELLDLAAQKKLLAPDAVRGQLKRMVADPKVRQFVENFVGQWLRVREFDTVMVENRFQYKDYDDALREAGAQEPYEFFQALLRADLPVLNVLDSDFLMINERLAKHYGVSDVKGDRFRRVPITPEQNRGGILGMAGLLTYLSDGMRTMPVKRGAYVLDVLWNTPASLPPPDAGNLPVVKGKNLTVRQRLDQHKTVPLCASCHVKIDPLGLALENYDAIGAWRERHNGEGRKGLQNEPPIDASGVMPDGTAFKTLPEFKRILLAEKGKFLKGFTERLLAYALGRPIGATDRATVERIIAEAAKEDYRLQAFLQALVADREFRMR